VAEPKIMILGGAGMLGHKLFQRLTREFPGTLCTTRKDVRQPPFDRIELLQGDNVIRNVDASDFENIRAVLNEHQPDFVVNCIGVIKQRDEARSAIPSITINSLLPHKLAALAATWGGRVLHFSTDCVFDGLRGSYVEEDDSNAGDLYGKSKFLGEVATENALTLRTSIIGRELTEHKSLVDWFLSQNHKKVNGFSRVMYSGVTTIQMAEVVADVIRKPWPLSGLFQLVSEPISKYDLLCLIRDGYQLDIEICRDETVVSDRTMKGDKLRRAMGYVSPPWEEQIAKMVGDETPYERWAIL
jgi:dTDP-4-dehydrorhamnose reductase